MLLRPLCCCRWQARPCVHPQPPTALYNCTTLVRGCVGGAGALPLWPQAHCFLPPRHAFHVARPPGGNPPCVSFLPMEPWHLLLVCCWHECMTVLCILGTRASSGNAQSQCLLLPIAFQWLTALHASWRARFFWKCSCLRATPWQRPTADSHDPPPPPPLSLPLPPLLVLVLIHAGCCNAPAAADAMCCLSIYIHSPLALPSTVSCTARWPSQPVAGHCAWI